MNAVNISKGITYTLVGSSAAMAATAFYILTKEISKATMLKTGAIVIPMMSLLCIGSLTVSNLLIDRLQRRHRITPMTRNTINIYMINIPLYIGKIGVAATLSGLEIIPSLKLARKITGLWIAISCFSVAGVVLWQNRNSMTGIVQRAIQHIRTHSIFSRFFTQTIAITPKINSQNTTQTTI